jgi:NADPH:quinone reductase-like Zn-dependent oxidoreductase
VISTSSSDAKLEIVKKLGARFTVNYTKTPAWEEEVLRLTNGKGVDHVVDIGGGGTIEQSLKCVKQGGLVSLVGFLASGKAVELVTPVLFGGKTCELLI